MDDGSVGTDPRLRIVAVRARLFRAGTTDGVGMSFAPLAHRSTVLVEVEGASGTIGRGESWVNYPAWAGTERLATIREGVAPLLLGRDAADLEGAHDVLTTVLGPLGRQWGAPGPISQAISGADIALWDLVASTRGTSIAELLGGRTRSSVPVYASSLGPTDVESTARRCVELGFRWVKVKLGFGAATDWENLRACRRAVGPDVTIVADANQAWTPAEAVTAAPMLEEAGVAWIEEPLRGDALGDLERFAERTGHRVATGENIYGLPAFLPYLRSPHIAVHQPDVTKTGGITEAARICVEAATLNRIVMPHVYGGAVALAASLQLAAVFPGIARMEYDIRSNPLRDPVTTVPFRLVDGAVEIPDGPGLGIGIDEAVLQRYELSA